MQENHTFDNYFGTFPGVYGTAGRNICTAVSRGSAGCRGPFHSKTLTPSDLNHNWSSAHDDYDGGKMDGFVYSEGSEWTICYFDGSDLSHYWNAASVYVLCERYFISVMGETAPTTSISLRVLPEASETTECRPHSTSRRFSSGLTGR